MSAIAGEGARKLGERLVAEVEVEDLSSVGWTRTTQLQSMIADAE
jgi:hypothetical protein